MIHSLFSALFFSILLFVVSGCTAGEQKSYHYYFERRSLTQDPLPEKFVHCHGYGCKYKTDVVLTQKEWKNIEKIFHPKSKSAEQERTRIEKSIGLFEQYIGEKAGTFGDIRGTFEKTGAYQLDCVDESTNTTVYLVLLHKKGHIHFHDIRSPSVRLPFFGGGGWPHQTAAIHDIEADIAYAVDSWFHDNGLEAHVLPLSEWKSGWKPTIPPRPKRKPESS